MSSGFDIPLAAPDARLNLPVQVLPEQTTLFEKALINLTKANEAVAMNSGSAALHMALLMAGVKPGQQVLCPTFTFAATANAIVQAGAQPVFVDAHPTNGGMCPNMPCKPWQPRVSGPLL